MTADPYELIRALDNLIEQAIAWRHADDDTVGDTCDALTAAVDWLEDAEHRAGVTA